jgi:hypothetical protein
MAQHGRIIIMGELAGEARRLAERSTVPLFIVP